MAHEGPIFEGFILGSRERADRFSQQPELMDVKGHFSSPGAEHHPFRLDKVADVEHLVEEFQAFLAHFVQAEEQLDPARSVLDMRKRDFSHRPRRPDASGQGGFDLPAIPFCGFEFSHGLHAGMGTLGARWIGFHTFGAKFFKLLQTDLFE